MLRVVKIHIFLYHNEVIDFTASVGKILIWYRFEFGKHRARTTSLVVFSLFSNYQQLLSVNHVNLVGIIMFR